ncbi:MurR/RpiR family transcriptional regulator [Pseudoalteromonas sp. H105]|jgi:DNA-binding MurR/RpiR family transcriptional regulator|uniref:MurR/RpiR family transcriptional regulator n=1 Tax=Pseudoalteromonas sp. H105 TaxID=1348393 RepID=UPI000731F80B|nr:MurR/RpiR family transcriptional regulator [Pseudoalteromonas sp. H105]KTF15656.1 RpiR family transcriptional regulator [Pseudoalteromonas sp. H105]
MSTFVKIKALRPSLSSSEEKLADFTLTSANAIRDLSSIELAKAAGVSQSSVVKFSQKLGYKGFPAFKLAVIDALNGEPSEPKPQGKITRNDTIEQLSEKLISNQHAVLSETKNLNETAAFEHAVALIKASKHILICGDDESALIAKGFSHKLQQLGMPAIAELDRAMQLAYAKTLGKNDLVIAITESGNNENILNIIKCAKQSNCNLLSLTQFGSNPVANVAHIKLYTITQEKSGRLQAILTRTAQDFVIDMLLMSLTQSAR